MSLTDIIASALDTTVTLKRRTNTADAYGDFTEVWNDLETGIRGTIQPVNVAEQKLLLQGKEFVAMYKCYIPESVSNTPKNGDRIEDESDSIVYNIVSVQRYRASSAGVSTGHHYKLILEIPKSPHS